MTTCERTSPSSLPKQSEQSCKSNFYIQKHKKPQKKQRKDQQTRSQSEQNPEYHWNQIQQIKYLQFLKKHEDLFDLAWQKRRVLKIHVQMSRYIGSRNSNQCRSHHQKMMNKYKSVHMILQTHMNQLQQRHKKKETLQKLEINRSQYQQEPPELIQVPEILSVSRDLKEDINFESFFSKEERDISFFCPNFSDDSF